MWNVLVSDMDTYIESSLGNLHKAAEMRTTLKKMVHQQPPTTVLTYNYFATRIINYS